MGVFLPLQGPGTSAERAAEPWESGGACWPETDQPAGWARGLRSGAGDQALGPEAAQHRGAQPVPPARNKTPIARCRLVDCGAHAGSTANPAGFCQHLAQGAVPRRERSTRTGRGGGGLLSFTAQPHCTALLVPAGAADDDRTLVADQPGGEAGQDRRQGGEPRPLRRVPAGRGRGVAADVRRHPLADRTAAGTTRAGMRASGSKCGKLRQRRCALLRLKQRVSAVRCHLSPLSIALCWRCARFAVAQAVQRRDPGLTTAGMWRMSDKEDSGRGRTIPLQSIGQLRRTPCKHFKLTTLPRIAI